MLYPRRVVIALGDDLPPGSHAIEIVTPAGTYARFFYLDDSAPAPTAVQWRSSADSEDTP